MPALTTVFTEALPVMPRPLAKSGRGGRRRSTSCVGDRILADRPSGSVARLAQRGIQDGGPRATLMCSPANMRSRRIRHAGLLGEREQAAQRRGAHEVFDGSTCRSAAWKVNFFVRSGSVANILRRSVKGVGQLVGACPTQGHRRKGRSQRLSHECS